MTTELAPVVSPAWTAIAAATAPIWLPCQPDQGLFERLAFAFHLSYLPHSARARLPDLTACNPYTSRRYDRSRHNLDRHPTYVLAPRSPRER